MRRWLPFLLLTLLAPGLWAGVNATAPSASGYENRNGSLDPAGYVNGLSLYAGYFAPNHLDWRGLSISINIPAKYGKNGEVITDESYEGKIMTQLQQVIGDCATLIITKREFVTYKRWVREYDNYMPWWMNSNIEIDSEYHSKSVLSYKSDGKNCICNDCWQDLKKAIDSNSQTIDIGYDRSHVSPSTEVRRDPNHPIINYNPDDPMGNSPNPELEDGSKETTTAGSIVLWHEAIGHGYHKSGHHGYPDATIPFENMARKCLKLQGIDVNQRSLYDPNAGVGWYPGESPEYRPESR